MSRVVISGIRGSVQPRLEIHDFVKDTKQWSLFVQATAKLQQVKEEQQISWFAVAGIHGFPYEQWGPEETEPTDGWPGYCTHGTVLFPTWHRPYMLAIEQFIHDYAVEIANDYPSSERAQWVDTAQKLRLPYWDWAATATPPPEIIEQRNVTIQTPQGSRTIANPMFQYKFQNSTANFPGNFARWPTTLRYPTSTRADAQSNVQNLKRTLERNFRSTRTAVYRLLTTEHTWDGFSNHTQTSGSAINLESIHDNMHNMIGGGGHMTSVPVAAFDPAFWLHHCQVDRLLSIWAALNPGVWVTQGDSVDGTSTIPPNTSIDDTTALTPFPNADTSYWASSGLQTTDALGYTYPDLATQSGGDAQREIANRVEALYGSSTRSAQARVAKTVTTAEHPAQVVMRTVASGALAVAHNNDAGMWDWYARVSVKEFELGESFEILIFLGEVPENPEEWIESESYVGSVSAFVNDMPERCANCRRQGADKVIRSAVYLTEDIAERSGLPGTFEPAVVGPYLAEHLSWRVRKILGGVPVPVSQVPSLRVSVFSCYLTKREGDIFPTPDQRTHHREVTRGKEGGYLVASENEDDD